MKYGDDVLLILSPIAGKEKMLLCGIKKVAHTEFYALAGFLLQAMEKITFGRGGKIIWDGVSGLICV